MSPSCIPTRPSWHTFESVEEDAVPEGHFTVLASAVEQTAAFENAPQEEGLGGGLGAEQAIEGGGRVRLGQVRHARC